MHVMTEWVMAGKILHPVHNKASVIALVVPTPIACCIFEKNMGKGIVDVLLTHTHTYTHTHIHTHARMHARTHARAHTHTTHTHLSLIHI